MRSFGAFLCDGRAMIDHQMT